MELYYLNNIYYVLYPEFMFISLNKYEIILILNLKMYSQILRHKNHHLASECIDFIALSDFPELLSPCNLLA